MAVNDRRRVVGVNRNPGVELIGARLHRPVIRPGQLTRVLRERGRSDGEADDQRAAGLEEVASRKSGRKAFTHRPPPAIASPARLIAFIRRGYVPQRQMCPFIAVRISASVGFAFFDSSSAALIIWPL